MNKLILKTVVCFVILFIQFQFVFAQDYISTKDGENLTVTVLKIDSVKILFMQFDAADTTQYFILKENATAIVFASNRLKNVKNFTFKNEPTYKSVNKIISPAYIYPTGGEMIKAVIENISNDQVLFKIAYANDTNTYFLKKTEIDKITFREILSGQKSEENLSDMELSSKGRSDAYQNYDGYKPAAVGSFVAGMFWWFYFVPVIVPITVSSTPPQEESLGMKDPKFMQKYPYSNAYSKTAKSIKSNKAWSNFGYGVATSLGLFVGLAFVSAYMYR